jgi:hypothetical protein
MSGRSSTVIVSDDDEGVPGPQNANGLAGLSDMGPVSDGRPSQRDDAEHYDYVAVEDDGSAQSDAGRPAARPPTQDRRLDDDDAGDGTYIERLRRQQADDGQQQEGGDDDLRARRREERIQRKQRQREVRNRSIAENERLRRELAEMRELVDSRFSQFDQGQRQAEIANLEQQIAAATRAKEQVEDRLVEAMTSGDGVSYRKALNERDQAFLALQQGQVRLNMLKAGNPMGLPADEWRTLAPRGQQPQQGGTDPGRASPPPPREVLEHHRDFTSRHPWFQTAAGPSGAAVPLNADSDIMLAIDRSVAQDGFDPRSPEYWQELEARAARRLPERFDDAGLGDGDYDEPAPQSQPRMSARQPARHEPQQQQARRGPPVAGGGDRPGPGGGTKVRLTPERKAALITANIIDSDGRPVDREKYQRVLRRYAEHDRNSGT